MDEYERKRVTVDELADYQRSIRLLKSYSTMREGGDTGDVPQELRLDVLLDLWGAVAVTNMGKPEGERATSICLKLMERQAALLGLDKKSGQAGESRPGGEEQAVTPQELAERVRLTVQNFKERGFEVRQPPPLTEEERDRYGV